MEVEVEREVKTVNRRALKSVVAEPLWSRLFPVFLIWLFLEGIVKKALGGMSEIVLIKDALLCLIYFSFFLDRLVFGKMKLPINTFLFSYALYLFYVLSNASGPLLFNKYAFLIGIRAQVFYALLFFVGYNFFASYVRINRYNYYGTVIVIFLVLYALYQVMTGDLGGSEDELFTRGGGFDVRGRTFGYQGVVLLMPTSVFSGFERFGRYCGLIFVLGVGVFLTGGLSERRKMLIYLCLGLAFVGLLLSGRRTALVAGVIPYFSLALYFGVIALKRFLNGRIKKPKVVKVLALFVVLCAGVSIIMSSKYSEKLYAFVKLYESFTEQSERTGERIYAPLLAMEYSFDKGGIFGSGTGTKTLGVERIGDRGASNPYSESGFAKILWEQGVLGFGLWLFLFGFLFLEGILILFNAKDTRGTGIAAGCLAYFLFVMAYTYKAFQFWDDSYQQIYLWIVASMLFSVGRIEKVGNANTEFHSRRENRGHGPAGYTARQSHAR